MLTEALIQGASLSHVRHELRTPINGILGYSEMLLEERQDSNDETTLTLKKIRAAGQRLLSLISRILSDDQLQTLSEADQTGILNEADQLALMVPVDAIEGYCKSLALKADHHLMVDLDHICQATNQLSDWIQELAQGRLGQALQPSLSKSNPSTSTLHPPLVPPAEMFSRPLTPNRCGHLLVVDDNESNRDLLSRQLKRQGHQIDTAINGEQALKKVASHCYDLVLLDILMPGLSGHEVLKQLVQHKDWQRIPVIMISALDELDSVVCCIEQGAADYLTKPFNPVILNARISACLEKKHLHDLEVLHLEQMGAANARMSRYLQEVDRITAAAAAVESNTFTPAHLAPVAERTDELGRLARVFTHTIQAIQAREQDLRMAEEQYRSIFENALKGIFQSSPDGHFISVNPAMAKIHRYTSPEDMIERVNNISQQIYVDADSWAAFVQKIKKEGTVKGFEYRSYCKDGTIIWTQLDARLVRDQDNNILYYEGSVQDVTERVWREEQLRRQLSELRIEIDQEQRQEEVSSLTSSNYFQEVKQEISSINLDDFWA